MIAIRQKGLLLIILLGILFFIVLVIPIKIPYSINIEGKIIPAKEWILSKKIDGSIQVTERDHLNFLTHQITTYQVERGDLVEFILHPAISTQASIGRGDTIGFIRSNETERQLAELKGRLVSAQANLAVAASGEKETTRQIAVEQVNQAKARLENQKHILNRNRELFEQNLISEEEYQFHSMNTRVMELDLLAAQAVLADLSSGAKPEQIDFYRNEIESIKEEIDVLNNRLDSFVLTSPFFGNVFKVFSEDTLLIVADTLVAVLMPLNIKYLPDISTGQEFTMTSRHGHQSINASGKLVAVSRVTRFMNNEEIFLAVGELRQSVKMLPLNRIISCSIQGAAISPREYVQRFLNALY